MDGDSISGTLPQAPPPATMRTMGDGRVHRHGFQPPATTVPTAVVESQPATSFNANPEIPSVIVISRQPQEESDKTSILRASSSKLHRVNGNGNAATAVLGKPLYVKISQFLFILTLLGVAVMGSLMIWFMVEKESELHVLAWGIGGFFVAFTIPISVHATHLHCRYYLSPLQRQYIRIIAMPIIYSVESWLALRYSEQRIYLETARDLYEAYVIYSFYWLLLQFLGGKKRLGERLRARAISTGQSRAKHLPPLCCLRGWRLGSRFVHRNNVGVYQYIVLRVLVSFITFACEFGGVYREGNWSPKYLYLYATIIINLSQCYALYCLALFYKELRHELTPLKPLGKFMVVKAVVFFSWWQSILISAASSFHWIPHLMDYESEEEVAKALQNLLICIEMFVASIAHMRYYGVDDFWDPKHRTLTPLMQMQRADIEEAARAAGKKGGSRSRKGSAVGSGNDVPPAGDPSVVDAIAGTGDAVVVVPQVGKQGAVARTSRSSSSSSSAIGGLAQPATSAAGTVSAAAAGNGNASARSSFAKPRAATGRKSGVAATAAVASGGSPVDAVPDGNGGNADDDDDDPYGMIKLPPSATAAAAAAAAAPAAGSSVAGATPNPLVASGSGSEKGAGDAFHGRERTGTQATAASGSTGTRTRSSTAAGGGDGEGDGDGADSDDAGDCDPAGDAALQQTHVEFGFKAALLDVLPGDIISETGEHFRTGFGLLHKWQKRKQERADSAARDAEFTQAVAEGRVGRSRPKSKYATAGDGSSGGDTSSSSVHSATTPSSSSIMMLGSSPSAADAASASAASDMLFTDAMSPSSAVGSRPEQRQALQPAAVAVAAT